MYKPLISVQNSSQEALEKIATNPEHRLLASPFMVCISTSATGIKRHVFPFFFTWHLQSLILPLQEKKKNESKDQTYLVLTQQGRNHEEYIRKCMTVVMR